VIVITSTPNPVQTVIDKVVEVVTSVISPKNESKAVATGTIIVTGINEDAKGSLIRTGGF
jgi:hypothetical protein